jgi:hypothetical protein
MRRLLQLGIQGKVLEISNNAEDFNDSLFSDSSEGL